MKYRVGVKRRFLPIWRIYEVVGHQTEIFGSVNPRLVLTLETGDVLVIPRIDRRQVRVYSEYTKQMQEQAQIEALKQEFQEL